MRTSPWTSLRSSEVFANFSSLAGFCSKDLTILIWLCWTPYWLLNFLLYKCWTFFVNNVWYKVSVLIFFVAETLETFVISILCLECCHYMEEHFTSVLCSFKSCNSCVVFIVKLMFSFVYSHVVIEVKDIIYINFFRIKFFNQEYFWNMLLNDVTFNVLIFTFLDVIHVI